MQWKIGIICAVDREVKPFLTHIENCIVSEKAMLKIYEGTIEGVSVVALFSGVCKVNAAIAAQILIDTYHVNAIINAGTAGGIDSKVNVFDTVISTQVAYHDVSDNILKEFHPHMPSIYFDADSLLLDLARKSIQNKKSDYAVYFGKMVTGDKFIDDINLINSISAKYAALSADMETASIAHVCYVNRVPFIAIRTITDTATHSGFENFEKNCDMASNISKDFVLGLLKEIKTYFSLVK
ncbi:5'-methylthioadenosine/adenosylhomocysteine nucleosidase [Clostridium thermosuccinogenes]|uniref:5'-methylthioadenosine/adenosylhomocysteine nucleosidase n=1 Tax=Clostridium thermosuccinogenes TaxID=84032 RepID=UPI000CCC0E3E|nr:5'-methylthioadenosine/adenosylhomocysteine nucleosidase [Pseudoclostridium thermosuccinogenes]PNT92559.1 5'-methylthioadenosine/S-adenosylhomocysteine nucleosidase [Pseudoclostridium thermosuccinogenes]